MSFAAAGTPAAEAEGAVLSFTWKHVLCWVHSFEEPDLTVKVAQALAEQAEGRCQVVMGLDSPVRFPSAAEQWIQLPLTPELIGRAERKLAGLYGSGVRTMVLPGHPVLEICRYARNHQVDLIVMGEQALSVEHAYGERLADRAPCTLMIILSPKRQNKPLGNERG